MDPPKGVPTSHAANPSNDPETFADPSGEMMQALTWQGKNKVAMVKAHKDLHLMHGAIIELEANDILGHEFMGIVESVGQGVTKVKVGDRVVASFNVGCGRCFMCRKKLSSACIKTNSSSLQNAMYGNRTCGMFGYSHFTGGFAGGQAEYVRVPWGDANLLKLPEEIPDEVGLYLSDVLVTSYHCVVDSGVKEGDIVGIWGLGPIGFRVIAIDGVKWRLDYGKSKLPQLETLDYNEFKDVPKRIEELTASDPNSFEDSRPPGLDIALECAAGEYAKGILHKIELAVGLETDTSEILNEMIASVIPFGTVGITGVYSGLTNHLNIGAVMEKGVRLIGNGQAPVHMHWEKILTEFLIPKKIDVVELVVSHRIDISQVAEYYERYNKREEGIMKVFVQTRFSSPPSAGAPKLSA
ncbi:hypothetical protein RQP46_004428 [Phenoliferia psychrophenolica]